MRDDEHTPCNTPPRTPYRTLVERFTVEDDFRAAYTELAAACVGLTAAPAGRADYLDLVGPDESDQIRADMTTTLDQHGRPGQSGCALVVRGLWRRAGIRHWRLEAPYHNSKAVEDLYTIALECRAYERATYVPKPGDCPHITGPEHVLTVAAAQPLDGYGEAYKTIPVLAVTSYDGGQREPGGLHEQWETIRERTRRWFPRAGGYGIIETAAAAAGDVGAAFSPAGAAASIVNQVTRRVLGTINVWKVYQRIGGAQ